MTKHAIEIIRHSDNVERMFVPLKNTIGRDFDGYRNHVYRVLTYAMHFLDGNQTYLRAVETALVHHDIGMRTHGELSYLEPSEEVAAESNQANGWGIDPTLLRNVIHWHHKVFPYSGPYERAVNSVRRADWVDATQGTVRKGLSKEQIAKVNAAIPALGFYETLERLAADLNHGKKVGGILKVIRTVYKW